MICGFRKPRLLVLMVSPWCCCIPVWAAEGVEAGVDPLWRYQIIRESVTRERGVVRYRVLATPNHEYTRGQYVITDVELNCSTRKRIEHQSVRKFRDGTIGQ